MLVSTASADEADDGDAEMFEILLSIGDELKAACERSLLIEAERERQQKQQPRR